MAQLRGIIAKLKATSAADADRPAFEDRRTGSVISRKDVDVRPRTHFLPASFCSAPRAVLTPVTLAGPQKKEGYLAEKTLWGFKKRYCVLKDGILFVFTDKVRFIHDTARHLTS